MPPWVLSGCASKSPQWPRKRDAEADLLLTRVFREKDQAEAFLGGQIRAGTLGSYRETEDPARGDPQEGISYLGTSWEFTLRSSRGDAHTFSYEAGDRMEMRFGWSDRVNVLCTTASYIGTEWAVPVDRYDEVIGRYVRIPESAKKFGDFAVLVHQPPRFPDRETPIDCAAEQWRTIARALTMSCSRMPMRRRLGSRSRRPRASSPKRRAISRGWRRSSRRRLLGPR